MSPFLLLGYFILGTIAKLRVKVKTMGCWLPDPRVNIELNLKLERSVSMVLETFKDFNYILIMRQRLKEIKGFADN